MPDFGTEPPGMLVISTKFGKYPILATMQHCTVLYSTVPVDVHFRAGFCFVQTERLLFLEKPPPNLPAIHAIKESD